MYHLLIFLTCVCLWSYFLVKYTYVFKSSIFNGEMDEEKMLFWIRVCNVSVAFALNMIEYFLAEDLDQFISFQILNHGKYQTFKKSFFVGDGNKKVFYFVMQHISLIHVHIHPCNRTPSCMWSHVWMAACMHGCVRGRLRVLLHAWMAACMVACISHVRTFQNNLPHSLAE